MVLGYERLGIVPALGEYLVWRGFLATLKRVRSIHDRVLRASVLRAMRALPRQPRRPRPGFAPGARLGNRVLEKCFASVPKPGRLFFIGVLVVAIGVAGFSVTYRSGNPFAKVAFGVAVTGWVICAIALVWGLVAVARYWARRWRSRCRSRALACFRDVAATQGP